MTRQRMSVLTAAACSTTNLLGRGITYGSGLTLGAVRLDILLQILYTPFATKEAEMEAKFTKGPWRVAGSSSPNSLIIATEDGPIHGRIAIVENKTGDCKGNANLITAAPEMYEALEKLLLWCEQSKMEGFDLFDNDCEEARLVLTKARGES